MNYENFLRAGSVKLVLGCGILTTSISPLQAHGLPAITLGQAVVIAAAATAIVPVAGSACTIFTYDKNGNRLTQVATTLPTSASTWGGAPYGCFVWHS